MLERGISLHVLRYWGGSVVIRNDEEGLATYAAVSCLADLERWRHIQRGELSRELKRKSGSAAGGQLPFFYEKTIKARGKKTVVKLVLKHWALKVMRAIEKAKDAGMNDQDVFDLAIRSAKFPSREIGGRITRQTWKGSRVECLYAFKKAWDAAGNPDINTFRIMDLIGKHRRLTPLQGASDGKADVQ